jgi:hypothetical protein
VAYRYGYDHLDRLTEVESPVEEVGYGSSATPFAAPVITMTKGSG